MRWKLTLSLPEGNGIDHLIMEDDPVETGGVFVYYLSTANPDFCFDDWYEKIEYARNVAAEYGHAVSDWQPLEAGL